MLSFESDSQRPGNPGKKSGEYLRTARPSFKMYHSEQSKGNTAASLTAAPFIVSNPHNVRRIDVDVS